MHDSVLVSFAILNVNWDEKRISYIDNFVPFVAECLKNAQSAVVSVPELQHALLNQSGLNIPQPALQSIAKRAAHLGLLERKHGVFRPNVAALAAWDLTTKRDDALRGFEALIDKFIAYTKAEFDVELQRESAESTMLTFVTERSLPILRSMLRREPFQQDLLEAESTHYLASIFIAHLFERDPAGFTYLETLVKGSMLATAVYLPGPDSTRRIADLTVFLDTPFILRALGYEAATGQAAATELMNLLRSLGARLGCFEHTLQELRGVLETCVHQLSVPHSRKDGTPMMPVLEHCLQQRLGASEMDRRIENLNRDLKQLGIAVFETPPYTERVSVDEVKLEEVLQENVHYQRENARLNDLQSLTAIYRLRDGKRFRALEDARAVFATPNGALVRSSRQFFEERPNADVVPICSLDYELATVAWLKRPVEAPDLPKKQLLAECYAAMYPSNSLWSRYLDEIDRLKADAAITEEDYAVLRYSVDSRRALMHQTLGSEEAFTVGTIEEVLRRAHANQQADLLAQLRDAREAADSEHLARLAAEEEATASAAAAREAKALATESVDQVRAAQVTHLRSVAGAAAHRICQTIFVLLTIVVAAAIVLSLPSPFPAIIDNVGRWPTIVVGAGFLVLAALTAFHLSVGTSIRSLVDSLEGHVASRLGDFPLRHASSEGNGDHG